jgi:hypothetical protein
VNYWLYDVASTGTFVKNPSMTSWTVDSTSGIPVGWTLVDDGSWVGPENWNNNEEW